MSIPAKLYLAGPMTGYPQFNFPAFLAAGDDLRKRGYEIVSPAELDLEEVGTSAMASTDGKLVDGKTDDGYTFGDFLSRDVKIVADLVEGVVTLPKWEQSKGARLEVYCALISEKPVYAYTPTAHRGMVELSFEYCADVVMPRKDYNSLYKKLAYV